MIYCFDLDGTLCQTQGSNYEDSQPIYPRIDIVNKLYDDGNTIYVDTARGSGSGRDWYKFTKEQIVSWGIKHHVLRSGVKFHADIFIDDRGTSDIDFFND